MKLLLFILCALLALPRLAAAQGFEPEDPVMLSSFQQVPVDRGIIARQQVMLEGVPGPGNQWRTSTCVAWAVAYAAGSYFHRTRLGRVNGALSPAFAYALGNGDARCLAASRVSRMLDVLRDIGGLPLSDYAYDPGWCGRIPTEAERRRAATFRIPGWALVPGLDPVAAKAQILEGRVVIFSMGVGPAFDGHRGKQVFDVLEPAADVFGHAMVAVGFDDKMQAFRIQNSAGTGWGDGGQAWLSYRVWRERAVTAYVITDGAGSVPASTAAASVPSSPTRQSVVDRLKAAMPAAFKPKPGMLEDILPKYAAGKAHRALALSFSDHVTYRQSDWSKPEEARQAVLERCQVQFGHPCVLFAEDDEPKTPASGRDWEPQDMPRARYSGPYDPTQVVALSTTVRQSPLVTGYGLAGGPKAMALHPWGRVFVTSAAASQREAEANALRRCNADPTRQGQDGPCYLYATGDQVVLTQRLTQPLALP